MPNSPNGRVVPPLAPEKPGGGAPAAGPGPRDQVWQPPPNALVTCGKPPPRAVHVGNGEYRVAVFGRRSSAHPGTRYLARGLNDAAAPGNEVEMEQIVWTRERDGSDGNGRRRAV